MMDLDNVPEELATSQPVWNSSSPGHWWRQETAWWGSVTAEIRRQDRATDHSPNGIYLLRVELSLKRGRHEWRWRVQGAKADMQHNADRLLAHIRAWDFTDPHLPPGIDPVGEGLRPAAEERHPLFRLD